MFSIIHQINNALREEIANEPKRNYIGASAIGHPCSRKIWYEFNGYDGEPISEKLRFTFDIGKAIETIITDYLKFHPCISFSQPHECVTIDKFKGSSDAIILFKIFTTENGSEGTLVKKVILEIKTANNASFNKFKKDGLKVWNEQYYAQCQSYMGMSDIHQCILLAINKDTSEMREEWIEYDDIYYQMLKQKAKDIIEAKEAPRRINNSPLFYICHMCKFKNICHSNQ